MKNDNLFEFSDNDIFSSSDKAKNRANVAGNGKNNAAGKHHFKKKRGIAGFFSNLGHGISAWWRRRKKWQKAIMITVTSLFLVLTTALAALLIIFDYNYKPLPTNPEEMGFENVIDESIVNVALFGIDSRDQDSFSGLSDSIMILSLNTETKTVKIISVLRDSLVPITNNGKTDYTKINAAYSKGGAVLAVKTLNTIFGLDISEYATVNFYGMSDIIDAVGGIDATLAKGEIDVMGYEYGHSVNYGINGMIDEQCSYMGIDASDYYITQAGEQHLNGVQAVAYARIRHAANIDGTNNDQGRTDRQRYVMEQLFNKATALNASQYAKLAKALIPCSETSLSYSEILGLAFNVLLKSPKFEQSRVPLEDYQMPTPSSGAYVYYDLDYASKIIKAFIYDNIKPDDYIAANGVEKNDWYAKRYSSGSKPGSNPSSSSGSGNTVSNQSQDSESSEPDSLHGNESGDANSGIISSNDSASGSSSQGTSSSEKPVTSGESKPDDENDPSEPTVPTEPDPSSPDNTETQD